LSSLSQDIGTSNLGILSLSNALCSLFLLFIYVYLICIRECTRSCEYEEEIGSGDDVRQPVE
jgi:hypothetical protein